MDIHRLIEISRQIAELQTEFYGGMMTVFGGQNPLSQPMGNEKLMSRQEVKDYLGISESTYIRKVKTGELKPIKMPGGDRFYKFDLMEAFIESIRRGKI